MKDRRKQDAAFTLIEAVVVIATLTLLAATLLPALAHTRPQAQRFNCSDNLRQVGLAFRAFAADHNGVTPMSVSPAQGGAGGDVGVRSVQSSQTASHGVCKMFLALTNYLAGPRLLFCPAEYETWIRQQPTTFAGTGGGVSGAVPYTNDLNVSYFIGIDASDYLPRMFLAGDHHLGGNANPPTTAFLTAPYAGNPFLSLGTNFAANMGAAWMDNMHGGDGNVGMADGSVEWFSRSNLQTALKTSGDWPHYGAVFSMATGSTAGANCNRIQLP
jgi:prepilin-type processing-associated H-X9-DG protein